MSASAVDRQLSILSAYKDSFSARVESLEGNSLKALELTTLQVNVGRVCNQACHHCHVDASPIRTESMNAETAEKVCRIIETHPEIHTLDITGGAPEMNPSFSMLVERSSAACKSILDRCNLTILEEEGYEHLYSLLSRHHVEIIASLPHFSTSRTDAQRGPGVFDKSITALKKLNDLGYGSDPSLRLNLVYNPSGLFLAADQSQMEREYREALSRRFQISFNHLFALNNMPINRFLDSLVRKEKFQDYMDLLTESFNPSTLPGLMCRNMISVGYEGDLYDCDFNQMLEMKTRPIGHIDDFDLGVLSSRTIEVDNHCYGCTAGAGSSCGGQTA